MPGEGMLTSAAAGWGGAEAVLFGAGAVAVVGLAFALYRHVERCDERSKNIHRRLNEVGDDVSTMRADIRVIATSIKHLEEGKK